MKAEIRWHDVDTRRANKESWDSIAASYGLTGNALRFRNQRRLVKLASTPPMFPDVDYPDEVNWRELLDTWEEVNDQHKRMDPYQERLTIDLSSSRDDLLIVSASDLHMGGGFTDHAAIKETIEYILDFGLKLGITGDSIEGFIPGVKPAETVEQQAGSVKAQLHALESLVEELVQHNALLWMSFGDHDAKWFEQVVGFNVVKHLVHKKVPYFTGRGLVRLLVGGQEYFLLINHWGNGSSRTNPNHPQRMAYEKFFPADVVITGHLHHPAIQMFEHYPWLRKAGFNLGGEAWLVQNGTFKTGPDPFSIRGWERGVMGVPTIWFSAKEHEKHVFKSPKHAVQFVTGAACVT